MNPVIAGKLWLITPAALTLAPALFIHPLLTLVKFPPTYNVFPFVNKLVTSEFILASKAWTAPVEAARAAILLRGCPPTAVNVPPTYKIPPESTKEVTEVPVIEVLNG